MREIGAEARGGALVIDEQLGRDVGAEIEAAFQEHARMRVGAAEGRIEARQVRISEDRAFALELRRKGGGDRRARADIARARHRGAEPVLAQHGGVLRDRLDDGMGLEEIGRIVAGGDAALEVDAAEIEERAVGRRPGHEPLTKIVADGLVRRKVDAVRRAEIHSPAIVGAEPIAELPFLARVEEEPLLPILPGRRRRRHEQRAADRVDARGIFEIEAAGAAAGGGRGRLFGALRAGLRRLGNEIEVAVLVGARRHRRRREGDGERERPGPRAAHHSTGIRGR